MTPAFHAREVELWRDQLAGWRISVRHWDAFAARMASLGDRDREAFALNRLHITEKLVRDAVRNLIRLGVTVA